MGEHITHRKPSEHIRSGHIRSEHIRTYASGKTVLIRECVINDSIINEGLSYPKAIEGLNLIGKYIKQMRKEIMGSENIQKPHMVKGHYRTNRKGEKIWVEPFYKNSYKPRKGTVKETVEVVEQRPQTFFEKIRAFFGF
ncbi:MAG TPA: hypothetical protein DEP37_01420 [Algoriphagus sp.]|nr:hypothetical protein [Algoriphagus sp.]